MDFAQLNPVLVILVAAAAGWTGDDWCPTPPRPPWPWPWLFRKIIAIVGGIGLVYAAKALHGGPGNFADLLTIAVLGLVGGAALTSLVNYIVGSSPRGGA